MPLSLAEWQIDTYAVPAMNEGYDFMAVDNVVLGNSVLGCGIKLDNGTFVQLYNGGFIDPAYNRYT